MSKTDIRVPKKKIAVIGLGSVGLPLALLADRKGYHVIGIEGNPIAAERLSRRESPFLDKALETQLMRSHLDPTTDFSRIKEAAIVILAIPTDAATAERNPDGNGDRDAAALNLATLRAVSFKMSPHIQKGQLVIVESPLHPGTCESVILPIIEKGSHLRGGLDFDLAHCPARPDPGEGKWRIDSIPRVVGGLDAVSLKRAISFYRSILKSDLKPMQSLRETEAVTIVENAFRDVNMAFANELALSFSRVGLDVVRVIEGASTKPFGFMAFYPGSVDNRSASLDPRVFTAYEGRPGEEAKGANALLRQRFLSLAHEINDHMPKYVVERLEGGLAKRSTKIVNANVAVLGLAYRPESDDPRESPSFEIVHLLRRKGAHVRTYDPYLKEQSSAKTLSEALTHADAAIIATAHEPFRVLRPHDFVKHGVNVIVDGRNCLPKEDFIKAGIAYHGIGR